MYPLLKYLVCEAQVPVWSVHDNEITLILSRCNLSLNFCYVFEDFVVVNSENSSDQPAQLQLELCCCKSNER